MRNERLLHFNFVWRLEGKGREGMGGHMAKIESPFFHSTYTK